MVSRSGRLRDILLALVGALLLVLLAVGVLPVTLEQGTTPEAQTTAEFLKASSININTATKEELMTIYGIGEALSGSIIAYREANGPFSSVEELLEVKGIGVVRLERMRKYVYVD